MTSKLDYLKKYMDSSEEPKKKKVRKVKRPAAVKIIDTNVDLRDVRAGSDSDTPLTRQIEEDCPQVAGVVDETAPEAFRKTFIGVGDDVRSRRNRRDSSEEASPRRAPKSRGRRDSSDESPIRKTRGRRDSSDESPPRRKARRDSSDESPPRRKTGSPRKESKRRYDSDESPPRRDRARSRKGDSDESPPRRLKKDDSDIDSPPRRRRRQDVGDRDIVQCEVLDGPEVIKLRGGKKESEAEAKREKEEKEARRKAIYDKWTAGVVQQQQRDSFIQDTVYEANKPLARAADDADLEERLRATDRDGDPMLAFLKKKKQANSDPGRPRYNGPQPPPNRYNIWPGYRWDGVDRSGGFEAKMMSMKNDKMATDEQAYKWSIEDM